MNLVIDTDRTGEIDPILAAALNGTPIPTVLVIPPRVGAVRIVPGSGRSSVCR
ncbi:MAG: hypothetical protein M5U19_04710 [Microthrixaceae bacterium]|nr:hypothetical protein [Microthrixaceae bacterium]